MSGDTLTLTLAGDVLEELAREATRRNDERTTRRGPGGFLRTTPAEVAGDVLEQWAEARRSRRPWHTTGR